MRGNNGALWEVAKTAGGVMRWRRSGSSVESNGSSCTVTAVLPVLFHDLLARQRTAPKKFESVNFVPEAARPLLRNLVRKNEFRFESLTFYDGVPLVARGTEPGIFARLFGRARKETRPATFLSYRLLERAGGKWAVEMVWQVEGVVRGDIDMPGVKEYLAGQLSDGWGEGVEQVRFGPLVMCDGQNCQKALPKEVKQHSLQVDLDGQYSFNLTMDGATLKCA